MGATATCQSLSGGIDEVSGLLDHFVNETGMGIGSLGLDWAGDAVRTELIAQNKDPASMQTSMLTQYVSTVGRKISKRLGCTSWIAHQINGVVAGKGPTHLPTHHDAEQCKRLAVNAAWAAVMGAKDRETNTCLFGVTKTSDGEAKSPLILKINGHIGRMDNAEDEFTADATTRKIIRKSEASRMYQSGEHSSTSVGRSIDI